MAKIGACGPDNLGGLPQRGIGSIPISMDIYVIL
jgi:hypothetical protein